tara:strand:- start:1595 stop:2122 length:528 start_codon:yes stop_codon:yes gene_type:complete
MNTFTAQELADFYQKVADGGEIQYLGSSKEGEWLDAFGGPGIECNRDQWRIKPAKKVINLSVLIDSQIDCTHDLLEGYGPLDNSWTEESLCEARVVPRTKYIHAWQGGECPLPEGFIVRVYWRNDEYPPCEVMPNEVTWDTDGDHSDIVHFEVLRVADGYVMPWEQEPCHAKQSQ